MAGNPLPAVWVPDRRTRDDREATRTRTDLGDKRTAICNQVQGLLKRHGLRRPETTGEGWTAAFRRWLDCLAAGGLPGLGVRGALGSLLRQLAFIEAEIARSEEDLERLAGEERYAAEVEAMTETSGVGVRVALTVLTELGDLERFTNRRQVGAFLGLVPQSDESGEASDRKGHITHQGPPQVRRMLCQAVLSWVRYDPWAKARYEHLVGRPKKGRKIAKVAMMRLLGIRLWRRARGARRAGRAARAAATQGGGRP